MPASSTSSLFGSSPCADFPSSLESIRSCEAFPKLAARRVCSNGELKENIIVVESPSSSTSTLVQSTFVTSIVDVPSTSAGFQPQLCSVATPARNKWRLRLPFALLPGEFVQYFSMFSTTAAGGLFLALTNFRLFVLLEDGKSGFYNVPVRCVDTVELRENLLIVACRDGRTARLSFPNSESCTAWLKLLQQATSPATKFDETFAFAFAAWLRDERAENAVGLGNEYPLNVPRHLSDEELLLPYASVQYEFKRLGFDAEVWRITEKNKDYKFSPSYPRYWIVPRAINDLEVEKAGAYRSFRRVPAVVWRHRDNGAILARSSQPEIGVLSWRCAEDERLVEAFVVAAERDTGRRCEVVEQRQIELPRLAPIEASAPNGHVANGDVPSAREKPVIGSASGSQQARRMLILDARSFAAAWANRAKGGGYECPEWYQKAEIQFVGLFNIHQIRKSFQSLRSLCANANAADPHGWLQALQGTSWLQNLSCLIDASLRVVEAIHCNARPVLVHCSDGWDRTTQIVSLAKLCLDPYYRSLKGFKELVDREWIEFGHKFSDRCGILCDNDNERSPIFLQWLDCVHQLLLQFPCSFEFNQTYLVKLAQHAYSGLFGNFIGNSAAERAQLMLEKRTISVWSFLHADNDKIRNVLYAAKPDTHMLTYEQMLSMCGGAQDVDVLWPAARVRDMRLWRGLYLPPPNDPARQRSGGGATRQSAEATQQTAVQLLQRSLNRAHSFDDLVQQTVVAGVEGQQTMPAEAGMNLSMVHHHMGCRTGSDSNLSNIGEAATLAGNESASCASLEQRQNHLVATSVIADDVCAVLHEMLQIADGTSERGADEQFSLLSATALSLPREEKEAMENGVAHVNGVDALDALDGGQFGLAVNAAQRERLQDSTSTITDGHVNGVGADESGSNQSTPVIVGTTTEVRLRQLPEMGTSTTDISDSCVRNPFFRNTTVPAPLFTIAGGERGPVRTFVGRTGEYTSQPLLHSNGVNGIETNGVRIYKAPSTYATPARELSPTTFVDAETKPMLTRQSLVQSWIDNDGLTRMGDVMQERLTAYAQKMYELESEVLRLKQTVRQQAASQQAAAAAAYFATNFRLPQNSFRLSNGSSSLDEKCGNGECVEPRSYDSVGGASSDFSWEAVDERDFRQTLWIPDHSVTRCMGCDAEFWAINRKHHCRSCGKVFCSTCSSFEAPVPSEQLFEPVRVCNVCFNALRCRNGEATTAVRNS